MASPRPGSEPLNIQLLVDSIPALIHTAMPDGYLDYFNTPWLEYMGATLEQVSGWNWTAFIHPEDVEGIVAKWRASLATGEIFEYETRVRRADGEYHWMFHRKVPLRDQRGDIVKWYGSSLDIEERKTAEEQLGRNTHALQRSEFYLAEGQRLGHMGSWAFDPDGFDYWSPELFRIYGLDPAGEAPSVQKYLDCVHPRDRESMAELINRLVVEARPFDATKRIVRPDGQVRYIRCVGVPFVDSQGVKKYVGSAIDVTEHELLTQELRQREADLAEAQRLSQTGSWAWSPEKDIRYWSEECYRVLSFDPQGGLPRFEEFFQRIHPDDQPGFRELIQTAIREKAEWEADYRIVHLDGPIRDIHVVCHPVLSTSGHLVEFVGTVIDVTERKRAEDEQRRAEAVIREQEAELRQVVDTIPAIVWSTLPDGSNTYVNKRFVEYSGSSGEQMAGSGWKALIHPDDLERHADKWMEAVATGKPLENEVRSRRSDGQYRWQLDRGVPLRDKDGNIVKWYGVTTDIEDRKRAEEALGVLSRDLQENKAKLEEAQRVAHVGYWEWDLSTDHVTWSDETYRIYGLHPQECPIELATIRESIHPEDREFVFRKAAEAIQGEVRVDAEHRIVRPNGEVRAVHSQGDLKRDAAGLPWQMFGTVQDITDRKLAEDKIREQEAGLRQILDLAPQNIAVYGPNRERLYLNRVSLDYFGTSLEEWQQSPGHGNYVHPDDEGRLDGVFGR